MKKLISFKTVLIIVTLLASAITCLIACMYFLNFNGSVSKSQEDWGTFGDFMGGTLNPILSYLSLIALLITIHLQVKELDETRIELRQSRIAQEEQSKNFQRQLDALDKKDKRDLSFHMLDRWTNQTMRTHRLRAWNYLISKYPGINDSNNAEINLYQFNKDNNEAFESFAEVCQFCSDLNKLISQRLVDRELCNILFVDSLIPWFIFIDKLKFERFEEILGKVYNENVENWYRTRVMTLKELLDLKCYQ